MIRVENLTKFFGKIRAVDHLAFEVKEGEILGLLGPNGAGKTTTMRILTGFLTPTEGVVEIAGRNVLRELQRVRRQIGYLPEDVPLYRDMTVLAFLKFVAALKGVRRSQRARAIEVVVERCKIAEVLKRLVGKLSKGYRQRVGLAQALIGSPKVLILDEPTSGLDPKQINEIRELIRSLRGKQTVLLSTHILPEASAVSDRVLIMNEGKVVAQGTSEELGAQLRTAQEILVTVRGDMKIVKPALHRIRGVLSVEKIQSLSGEIDVYKVFCDKDNDVRGEVARVLVDSGFDLLELRSNVMSLEDIFLRLVTKEDPAESEAVPEGTPQPS
ncbi:MAG: ABC transporter ATP-binding protein [Candidatus Omnitrophica bacterium]|nr:ABC transporter ATP-binding protein [Candidatus Omnitrophota bacterium]